VINNAGVGYRSFVELAEDDKIDQIVNVNLLGVVKCSFIPVFRSQNKGHFINISSIAGFINLPLGAFIMLRSMVWKVFQNVWPMNY
jgi:short-subunit dehydrogenase